MIKDSQLNKKRGFIMDEVLGFDCDGYEIEEFRILRFPFSADIENWDEEVGVDPRFYCIVKRDNGENVLVSVYDDYLSRYIRRYENRILTRIKIYVNLLP